jgi:hypothetical protein
MNPTTDCSNTQEQLLKWAGETSFWIADVLELCRPMLSEKSSLDDHTKYVLWQLAASCHSTSESALLLVCNVRLWDADVLVRSVVEGTLKFVFLTIGTEAERKIKIEEFDTHLAAFGQMKRHQRLEEFLAIVDDPNADEWKPFRDMLLTNDRLAEFREAYPRKTRQQLEQKWSFGGICAALRKSGQKGIDSFGHMLFNYGLSSHVAHQDTDGIGMVWDRNNRSERRRIAVELAHGGRLVGDIATMAWLRAHTLFQFVGADRQPLKDMWKRREVIAQETADAVKHFHEVEYGVELP